MNSKVHAVLMKCAIDLCGSKMIDELNKQINVTRWETYLKDDLGFNMDPEAEYKKNHIPRFHNKTYSDLLVYGAYMEDQTKFKSDVPDPELKDPIMRFCMETIAGQGKYQHWLEHFWNDSFEKDPDQGLMLTVKYICDVVKEALGVDKVLGEYFKDIGPEFMESLGNVISEFFNGSKIIENFRSAPERAKDYWDILIDQYKEGNKEAAYFNLGKVCHLLADVCTPCHMHGDSHLGFTWISKWIKEKVGIDLNDFMVVITPETVDDDKYEVYTGKEIESNIPMADVGEDEPEEWLSNIDSALPERWRLTNENGFPTYDATWDMYKYFKHAAQITVQFDSDDHDGSRKCQPYSWAHFDPLSPASWTMERRWDGDLTEYACDQIASQLIPLTIADTAGLLYRFSDEVGLNFSRDVLELSIQAEKIKIIDDEDTCEEGELYFSMKVNDRPTVDSGRIKADSGDVLTNEFHVGVMNLRDQFMVHDLSTDNLIIETWAYDNDDWDVLGQKIRKSQDSLGSTFDKYSIRQLDPETVVKDRRSSNDDYEISYRIDKKTPLAEIADLLKQGVYKAGDSMYTNPVLLNLTTMQRHCNAISKGRPCGTWNRISSDISMGFFMTVDQLFGSNEFKGVEGLRKFAQKTGRKKLEQIADQIENSDDPYLRACREPSVYRKYIRLHAKNDREFDKWNMINEDTLGEMFELKCSCCNKPYYEFLTRKNKKYLGKVPKKMWIPCCMDPDRKRKSSKQLKFEELRKNMYVMYQDE